VLEKIEGKQKGQKLQGGKNFAFFALFVLFASWCLNLRSLFVKRVQTSGNRVVEKLGRHPVHRH